MSVIVRLEITVVGTDDAQAVRSALLLRGALEEMSGSVWFALQDAEIDADPDVTSIEVEPE